MEPATEPEPGTVGNTQDRRHVVPFGCTAVVFGAVTALITAIIVGAAVGGGVGGALSSRNAGNCEAATSAPAVVTVTDVPSSTVTPTAISSASSVPSSSSPSASPTLTSIAPDCPALNAQTYVAESYEGQRFDLHCNFQYNGDDITAVWVYSWEQCVRACAAANHYAVANGRSNTTCMHSLYDGSNDDPIQLRNCWIKGGDVVVATPDPARKLIAADLIV